MNYYKSRTPHSYYETQRKGGAVKFLLSACAVVIAIAAVAFVSINAYVALTGYGEGTQPSPSPTPQAERLSAFADLSPSPSPAQSGTSEPAQNGKTLTGPQIAAKGKPSVAGIICKIPASQISEGGTSTGSGIILTEDGYIVTNAHVVEGATDITVVLNDKTEYPASLIGMDTLSDLAVVKIDEKGLAAAELGDSDKVVDGESVIAIGNPLGMQFAGSVTGGIISAVDRQITVDDRTVNVLQTDASINSGNSGGPLLNSAGEVIGINSIKIVSSKAEGMGFAIPINDALPIIDDLIKNGYVTGRPALGISGETVDSLTAHWYNVPMGVLVISVNDGMGAQEAGLTAGDIIYAINGTKVSTMSQLNAVRDKFSAGDTVTLSVYRNGRTGEVNVVLSENTGGAE